MDGSVWVLAVAVLALVLLPQLIEDFAMAKHEKQSFRLAFGKFVRPWNAVFTVLAVLSAVGFHVVGALTPLTTLVLVVLWVLVRTDVRARVLPDFLVLGSIPVVFVWLLASGVSATDLLARFMLPGVLMVVTLYGNWVLRRGSEAKYPEYPMGYMQVGAASLVGFFNLWAGLGVFVALVVANLVRKQVVRVPDFVVLPLLFVVFMYTFMEPGVIRTESMLVTAGLTTLVCGIYWWATPEIDDNTPYDPISFGFGDTKLMVLLAMLVGVNRGLDLLIVSLVLGIVLGLVYRWVTREKHVPFGPALVLAFILCVSFPDFVRLVKIF